MQQKKPEPRYTIEVTESQLRLIANCVEDIHRFLGGQTELFNTCVCLEHYIELREKLNDLKPLVTPALPLRSYYGWNGGACPNRAQRICMAKTYAIYREIYHQLNIINNIDNVYTSPTLTCDEGGELPKIKKL